MSGVGGIDNIADTNVDKLASSKRVLKTVDLALTQALKLVVVDSALDSALTLLHAQCLGKENEDTKPDVKFLESIIFSDVQSEPSHKSIEEPVSVASKVKSLQNFPSGRLDKKTDIKVHQAQLSLSPPHKPNILLAERPNIFELFADVYRMADSNQSNVEHDPAKTSRERGDNDCHPVANSGLSSKISFSGSHGNILMGEHSLSGSEAAVLQRAEKVQSPRFEDASVQAKPHGLEKYFHPSLLRKIPIGCRESFYYDHHSLANQQLSLLTGALQCLQGQNV
ncbi:hypothetical protein PoB_005642800 [Plakobranchus ocellatus]|uniref:Uncharacterized protein n=1 Tax=Plakobranchus ocellatus TaxID=259542 RepID=A0AAV4CFZ1_9GAST|nr:hypothetical protein PoB_005642800 [Plakobranchus ocellatus]